MRTTAGFYVHKVYPAKVARRNVLHFPWRRQGKNVQRALLLPFPWTVKNSVASPSLLTRSGSDLCWRRTSMCYHGNWSICGKPPSNSPVARLSRCLCPASWVLKSTLGYDSVGHRGFIILPSASVLPEGGDGT